MRKKIFLQMLLLASSSIFLVSIVLSTLFYTRFTLHSRADLQKQTQLYAGLDQASRLLCLNRIPPQDMRVTLISPDGSVLFDNTANPLILDSHGGRKEIENALAQGSGESRRFSKTLGAQTYYYAVRLPDGSVLRAAKTANSIWRLFAGVLPVSVISVLLFVTLGYFISRRLAKKFVEPIGNVDFTQAPPVSYDELAPYVKTIVQHREQIERDRKKIQSRTATINAIMDNMDEGVVLLDKGGSILSANKSAARIFNVKKTMEGQNVLELLRDIRFSQNIRQALQGHRGEMTLRKSEKEYRVLISPVAGTGVVVLFLDITEKSAGERMRREFSANVSHELKTPLTSIYGNAEMLREGVVKDSDKPLFYEKIMNEASRLIALIDDIILLSELDEGNIQEQLEPVNLAEVAAECAEALEQKAAEHRVTVHIAGSGTVKASRFLMHEMFYNLIDNAIKYNTPNGNVEVTLMHTDTQTEITVADKGIGIPDMDQKRIFERFYRADKSRSKKSGGTGLGLAIVKHAVLAHGGSIHVTSKPGEGAVFRIVFNI